MKKAVGKSKEEYLEHEMYYDREAESRNIVVLVPIGYVNLSMEG